MQAVDFGLTHLAAANDDDPLIQERCGEPFGADASVPYLVV